MVLLVPSLLFLANALRPSYLQTTAVSQTSTAILLCVDSFGILLRLLRLCACGGALDCLTQSLSPVFCSCAILTNKLEFGHCVLAWISRKFYLRVSLCAVQCSNPSPFCHCRHHYRWLTDLYFSILLVRSFARKWF